VWRLEAERAGQARLMIGYMKRYDPASRLARDTVRRWRQDPAKGQLVFARNHGFCGDWLAGLDTSGLIQTDEPLEPVGSEHLMPEWLPAVHHKGYVAYLQQFTHNVNLLRFLLDVTRRDQIEVRHVDLARDGFTGTVSLRLGGTHCTIESARTGFHGWDEHTQVYFEGGWVRVWPGPFFARPSTGQVELYESGPGAAYRYPIPQPLSAWHYREEAAHFLARLRDAAPFESSGQDAWLDVWTFEQIYRQHVGSCG
jgi:predicted dehydrogenase